MVSAHVCRRPPEVTRSVLSCGADAWPRWFLPQQTTEPSVRTPQVCREPASIVLNVVLSGGDTWPKSFSTPPQQTAAPFACSAQVWVSPALIAMNFSSGGEDCFFSSSPQHTGVPSPSSAHV